MALNLSRVLCAVIGIIIAAAPSAEATPITFVGTGTGVNAQPLSAKATFVVSGGDLIVTLSNISTADVNNPADILTAVFFRLAGNPALTPVSALLGPNSTVFFGSANGGNVGGEWAYDANTGGGQGIGSAGFGIFGGANFNGPNLHGPTAVAGINYGITSAGDDILTGNSAVTGGFPLISGSVVFTLSGIGPGFNPDTDIIDVTFQYGSSLSEPSIRGTKIEQLQHTPEPSSIFLLGSGILVLAWRLRKRQHKTEETVRDQSPCG
jgi:hypothetical protein